MDWERRLKKIILLLFFIISFGVIGLMMIEGWSFLDALYMTIITMSTVGYSELYPVSPPGKVFLIVLIVLGVGSFFYIITTGAEHIISGHLRGVLGRRRMNKKIDVLKDHYIICGFGRVGEQVAHELASEGIAFVVLDNNRDSLERCAARGYYFIEGDASSDERLKNAGILRAKGLVAATDSDADNVYVILSAKSLNNKLFVVARANIDESEHKLRKAGADRVLSPYSIGGRRLASLLLRPAVVEFLDVVMHSAEKELFMEDIPVHERSPFIGATIAEARIKCATGANILAIKKKESDRMILNPSADTSIEIGDLLIALGTKVQLKELEGLT